MKKEFVTETITIVGILGVLSALILLIAGAFWIPNVPDLAFLIPFFGGTSGFFVGMYREAKYSETYDIPYYISNRKMQMRAAILGGSISVIMTIISVIYFI